MSMITARPWKLLKCPCGHPSCRQYQFANQGSYGLDKDDAEFALRAINAFDAMVEAAEELSDALSRYGFPVSAAAENALAAAGSKEARGLHRAATQFRTALALARGERS
ncbi:hypothetical protein GGR16_002375 [Chelatococcus caeni]|uniref:Uncharacterized protein n=1 Tax=Chelatococcus caeni TaxID=1348468 RepID=A0A840C349_9HYPH|nr:hypothetical protein [Chelatococcus caeni]MBB4017346.1 hypothetical protein [Chelatococcus caeni]